jgi:plastocyanin
MTQVMITFPVQIGPGPIKLKYNQPCIRVSVGTTVAFSGDFTNFPLAGGNSPPTVDTTSPIPETKTGLGPLTVPLNKAGTFGYFCETHYAQGMEGAIIVQ